MRFAKSFGFEYTTVNQFSKNDALRRPARAWKPEKASRPPASWCLRTAATGEAIRLRILQDALKWRETAITICATGEAIRLRILQACFLHLCSTSMFL